MKTGSLIARLLAVAILLFTFALAVYRAKVQTIAHDEALTYEWFLNQGVEYVLHYNATNHVLFTLLAKPIVWAMGVSEFKLRLPSVGFAALYLIAAYLLSRKLFGDGVLMLLSVSLLTLNPQILDFMVAARGYILGLACLCGAMYFIARLTDRGHFDCENSEWKWGCSLASLLLGLSVVAVLTNVIPAVSLALTFTAAALGGLTRLRRLGDRTVRVFAGYFFVPGASVSFCLLWPYLIQARPAHFYAGFHKVSEALRDTFAASFLYKWTDDIYAVSLGALPPAPGSWQERTLFWGAYAFLPLIFLLVAVGLMCAYRSTRKEQSGQCRVFSGAAVASVALTVLLNVLLGVRYPVSRASLYFILLFTVGGLLAAQELSLISARPLWRVIGMAVMAAIIVDYAFSLQTATFRYNAYDVISRELYDAIERDARSHGLTNVRVGGTWWYEPEINFYRLRFRAKWMQEYEIKDKSYWWNTPNSLTPADYDYFVFIPVSDPGLSGPRIRTIYHDEHTEATIIAIARE